MNDQQILERIQGLDLEPIVFNLTMKDDGPRWELQRARMAEKWYRRFLFLVLRHPDVAVVPTKEIDEVWHMHILDTRKYFGDCQELFGEYLHHFPYLGARGEDDKRNLEEAFSHSLALFEMHFNEIPASLKEAAGYAICSSCSSKCGKETVQSIRSVDLKTRPSLMQ